jgi:hypothetical protein
METRSNKENRTQQKSADGSNHRNRTATIQVCLMPVR